MEQNNSQKPYRPKIAGILFVCNDPAQFACLQHQQGQYIAAQGCQGRLRHSVDRMLTTTLVDRSYITTRVLVSELSDRHKQQTRDQ